MHMSAPLMSTIRVVVAALCLLSWARVSVAEESDAASASIPRNEVAVVLHGGRTLSATIDSRATQAELWLRWENEAALIRQRVAWADVVLIETLEETWSADDLRRQLPERSAPEIVAADSIELTPVVASANPAADDDWSTVDATVRSLSIDARAANWNADPAADGVLLTVYPLNAAGDVVPVRGRITAELIGDVTSLRKPQPKTRFTRWSRLGYWARPVRTETFTASGADLKLPFQAYDPEFDSTVRSRTLLTVRLTVPGQGVFQASLPDVWVRPFSPLRNRIEATTGRRYLPEELRGR